MDVFALRAFKGPQIRATPLTPSRWGWQLNASDEVVAEGFEDGQIEAKFEGYNAMFLLLAAGWAP